MLAIKMADDYEQLADGDEPYLHRLIHEKHMGGEWQFPILLISNKARVITDQEYYSSLTKDIKPTDQQRVAMIDKALKAGKKLMREVVEYTGLTESQIRTTNKKHNISLHDVWVATGIVSSLPVIQTITEYDMAILLGVSVRTIQQVVKTNGIVFGYRIKKQNATKGVKANASTS